MSARARPPAVIENRHLREPVHTTGPYLIERDVSVEVTEGDFRAIWKACVRLLRGESITSTTPDGERVDLLADRVRVAGRTVYRGCAHDCAVYAYGRISSWQRAWMDFENAPASERAS